MIALTMGGLAVAALVVWALMRTVQPPASGYTEQPAAEAPSATATAPAVVETPQASTSTSATAPPPAAQGDRTEVPRISVEDLREQHKAGAVTIIDVRDAAAFEGGHIAGALNMPFASIEGFVDMIPKGKAIVTYCT